MKGTRWSYLRYVTIRKMLSRTVARWARFRTARGRTFSSARAAWSNGLFGVGRHAPSSAVVALGATALVSVWCVVLAWSVRRLLAYSPSLLRLTRPIVGGMVVVALRIVPAVIPVLVRSLTSI